MNDIISSSVIKLSRLEVGRTVFRFRAVSDGTILLSPTTMWPLARAGLN